MQRVMEYSCYKNHVLGQVSIISYMYQMFIMVDRHITN